MTQKQALDILKTGANVFLTGPAGSGKTHVLREYLSCLRDRGISVGITASTGIAATHMGGITIHSWSGIGVKDSLTREDVDEIANKQYLKKKIKKAKVLVIDEISMIHDYRFSMVDRVVRRVKNIDQVFGGMQIVVCGDFFQLPPIWRQGEPQALFAYHSSSWRQADFIVCYLEEQYRQNDQEFISILNDIRNDKVNTNTKNRLLSKFSSKKNDNTRLYSHNRNVDEENDTELSKIDGRSFQYTMKESGNKKLTEILKNSCLAPQILKLKRGAKVMSVKNNFDRGYVNGTLGIVEECGFDYIKIRTNKGIIEVPKETWKIEEDGRVLATIEQFPLRLAWAITIHKSQGMSLDSASIDLSKTFEKGMGYVALSRLRSLDGLSLHGLNDIALMVSDEALNYDRHFRDKSKKAEAELISISTKDLTDMHKTFLGNDPSPEEIRQNRKVVLDIKPKKKAKRKEFYSIEY